MKPNPVQQPTTCFVPKYWFERFVDSIFADQAPQVTPQVVKDCSTGENPCGITAHIVCEDARYPILCINGKFTYGLTIDPETGYIGRQRFCICFASSNDDCICDL